MTTARRRFINFAGAKSQIEVQEQYDAYVAYLTEVQESMPKGARAFARAPYHFNGMDRRCPHDGRLRNVHLAELKNDDKNIIQLEIELLGAYSDGVIRINYQDVLAYALSFEPGIPSNCTEFYAHGDWLEDEVILDENGFVLHDISFRSGARWRIRCRELVYNFEPLDPSDRGIVRGEIELSTFR